MAYQDLNPAQRLVAVHTDMMRNKNFSILGGVTQIGKVTVTTDVPTAGTDGCDVYYNPEFVMGMTRKQLRYLCAHEALHKALHHCTDYQHLKTKHPEVFAQAVDYVVNDQIETMDTDGFVERPTSVPPLIDPEYHNMSVPEVMRKLLDKQKQNPQAPQPQPMDEHKDGAKDGEGRPVDTKELRTQIDDAVAHGAIIQTQLRGEGAGGSSLGGFQQRVTDWRPAFRKFMQEACEGEDQSRFSPPNRRMLPLDVVLPSHFSEAVGDIIIACDTSASMHGVYPVVFGEIARIAQTLQPNSVRILWWDTAVRGEQSFTTKDYPQLARAMAPKGGGGTTVSCVARHIKSKGYKPKAVVLLSDGYLEAQYELPAGNVLWGIVGNAAFRPLRGKTLHIQEVV